MKKKHLFLMLLIMLFGFLVGCSRFNDITDSIGSGTAVLDKAVFEKNHDDCIEVMAVYFKGENITKVEVREIYKSPEALSKAYKSYSESSNYTGLRSSGLDIGYEYSSAYIYNSFDGIRGKDNIIDVLQKDRGYTLK